MKKILCFGDSNTYGFVPKTCGRYDKSTRWTGILSELLGSDFEVIEGGMNNRTGFFKNPEGLKQSGGEYLPIYLQNHRDIDICVLSLGTNDAQFFYKLDEKNAKTGLEYLITTIREANAHTKIIIIPPVKISDNILSGMFSIQFDKNSIQTASKVFPIFKKVAEEKNCFYFDFNEFVTPSEEDGLHYSADSHRLIAQNLYEFIVNIKNI
jgi:lysophospholipase L1-like esterase